MNRAVIVLMAPMLLCSRAASAQTDENRVYVGVQLAGAVSGEFEGADVGFGGRLAWHPTAVVGVEAEVNWHPSEYDDEPAFSWSRVEGLFGVTMGPRLGTVRPFAMLRPGFLTYREAPEPIPCIAIFPPPLRCRLAAGDTVFALDIGGGIEWFPTGRTFARVDAGDRVAELGPSPQGLRAWWAEDVEIAAKRGGPRRPLFTKSGMEAPASGGIDIWPPRSTCP